MDSPAVAANQSHNQSGQEHASPIASGFITSLIAIGFAQQVRRIMMRRRDFIAALGGAVAWMAAAVSFSAAQVVILQPLPLKQFLEESGWVSLPLVPGYVFVVLDVEPLTVADETVYGRG
jgi:hypothetical protein